MVTMETRPKTDIVGHIFEYNVHFLLGQMNSFQKMYNLLGSKMGRGTSEIWALSYSTNPMRSTQGYKVKKKIVKIVDNMTLARYNIYCK